MAFCSGLRRKASCGKDASCLSQEDFDKLLSGEEEASLEVGLKSSVLVHCKAGVRPAAGGLERFVQMLCFLSLDLIVATVHGVATSSRNKHMLG